jgi:hypothetical protein
MTINQLSISVYSTSGGIGTSVFSYLLALALKTSTATRRDPQVALVDMDFSGGGLDILLGLEADEGLRWSDIRAPSGQIAPEAFKRELVDSDGIRILSADPWNMLAPDAWEIRAALKALEAGMNFVVCDCGHGFAGSNKYGADDSSRRLICLAELSVLGLARARTWLGECSKLRENGPSRGVGEPLVIGVEPWGARSRAQAARSSIPLDEASEYLDHEIIGKFHHEPPLAQSILEGFGVESLPKSYRKLFDTVIERLCGLQVVKGGLG